MVSDTAEPPQELIFYDCKVVVNEKDTFSGIVLEPGVNSNLYFYDKADVARFALELPKVPLVKDHGLSINDAVGSFQGSELRDDGAAIGHFRISQSEPQILAKVKDGTIRNLSIAHTRGSSQYCSICRKALGSKDCPHVPGEVYNGVKCGMGFTEPRLVHVALVQRGAGDGTSVITNEINAKVKSLVDEVENLKLINAKQADELAKSKAEYEKVRALRIPEPQGRIAVQSEPPRKRTLRDELGV